MGHQPVEALLVQRIGLQGPVGSDALRRAERSVAVAVVQESVPFVPEVFVDVAFEHLHLLFHPFDLLPPFDVESDLEQRLVHEHLLQVGVEPYHVAVRKDRVVFGFHARHVVHARAPAARPVGPVGPRAVELPPLRVAA